MKANRIDRGRGKGPVVILVAIGLALASVCAAIGYGKLREIYIEACLITDMASQVEITSGKMVKPGTLAEEFGLKVGKNLAEIDFSRKRTEILSKIPNLKSIRIVRRLPDKVIIDAEERTPIARLGVKGSRQTSDRVVDSEGVIFLCHRGTQTLPLILESKNCGMTPGKRVDGRLRAALRLIEACREPDYLELGLLEVDTSKHDFLTATLGNYSRLKILWEDMDEEQSARSRADLTTRLTQLRDTIRQKMATGAVIWNATIPGRIFADTQGTL